MALRKSRINVLDACRQRPGYGRNVASMHSSVRDQLRSYASVQMPYSHTLFNSSLVPQRTICRICINSSVDDQKWTGDLHQSIAWSFPLARRVGAKMN